MNQTFQTHSKIGYEIHALGYCQAIGLGKDLCIAYIFLT